MTKKDDLYIEILKYGKANISGGITFSSLKEHLKKLGFKYETIEDEKHWRYIFVEAFSSTRGFGAQPEANLDSEANKEIENPAYLDTKSYFSLLEHEELRQARNSSLWATGIAIAAIIISIISTGFSIYYSQKQIHNSISLQELKEFQFDQDSLNNRLEKIIENQDKPIEVKLDCINCEEITNNKQE